MTYTTLPVTNLTERQRRSFSCGVAALDDYFKQFAKGNHNKNIGKTFVLLEDKTTVIGYYTICMGSVDFSSLPHAFQARVPKYPIPIARIGRLAVNIHRQGRGWGEFLLIDALNRIRDAALSIAAFGVVVDAKDDKARDFYIKFGFQSFVDNNLCLFLPIQAIFDNAFNE